MLVDQIRSIAKRIVIPIRPSGANTYRILITNPTKNPTIYHTKSKNK